MLKQTIKYTDFDGVNREDDFYFNLTAPEAARLAVSEVGGLEAYITRIFKAEKAGEILDVFEKIIRLAVGIKSPDGRRFVKSPEITEEFMQCPAYEELFLRFVTDAEFGAEFIKGIVPQSLNRPDIQEKLTQPELA